MSKEKISLLLWIIFGFIFITSVYAIIDLCTTLFYCLLWINDVSINIFKFAVAFFTIAIYGISSFYIYKIINKREVSIPTDLSEFPKVLLFFLVLIAIFLKPLTNRLFGWAHESSNKLNEIDSMDYIELFNWWKISSNLSKWLILIIAAIWLLKSLKSNKLKN